MITDEDVAYFLGFKEGVEWFIEKLKKLEGGKENEN